MPVPIQATKRPVCKMITKPIIILSASLILLSVPLDVAAQSKGSAKKVVKKPTKKVAKKPVVVTSKPKVNPLLAPMVGTWYTVDSAGKFVKANKFAFTKEGGFKYIGPGWSSEGTFSLAKDELKLTWTKVDNQKVARPFSKSIVLDPAAKQFRIERFLYGKAAS